MIALGVCAVSMTFFVLGMEVAVQASVFIAWVLMAVNPLVIAVLSPALVRQTTGDESYQLLKLTPLSPDEIRQGITQAALFRSRVRLAVQIGLLPVWVAEMFSGWYFIATLYPAAPPPENPNIAAPLIVLTLMGIGVFGLNLVAATIGVGQGLRSGQPARRVVVSLGAVLLVPVLCYIPGLTLLGPAIGVLWWDLPTSLQAIGLVFISFVLPPYGLSLLLYRPVSPSEI